MPVRRDPIGSWLPTTIMLGVAFIGARLGLHALLPLALTGDEAQYWDWSRRHELSYYTKGPGVARAIELAEGAIGWAAPKSGVAEWIVRAPSAVALVLTMLALAGFAWRATGRARIAIAAGALVVVVPAYQLTAAFATIDMPYIACWALSAWLAWEVIDRWRRGRHAPILAIALGAVLAVGFLFKFTILLLPVGLVAYALIDRVRPRLSDLGLGLIVFAYIASDVALWNAQHDWPTVAHLLGHLHVEGGDIAPPPGDDGGPSYSPLWTLEFLALQLAAAGPVLALIALALRRRLDPLDRFCVVAALPIFAMYLGATFFSPSEANWPIAGYITVLIPVARILPRELRRQRRRLAHWRTDSRPARERPKAGILRRAPETPAQIAWHWSIGAGVIGFAIPVIAVVATHIPALAGNALVRRVSEPRALAAAVYAVALGVEHDTGHPPAIIANRYTRTGTLAYYVPGMPSVSCGSAWLGDRASAYDYFEDTRLDREGLAGRPAILVGSSGASWAEALGIDEPVRWSDRFEIYVTPSFPSLPTRVPAITASTETGDD
ncbi:MAG: glycosyltransferase family 39 protein [Planctomycetota bacterium]